MGGSIGVLGLGYVGLVTSLGFVTRGHRVVCHDKNDRKKDLLEKGGLPIHEPGLLEILKVALPEGKILFEKKVSDVCRKVDLVFVCVGTPEDKDGSADLSQVLSVGREIGASIERPMVVVVKSTVPVGTCERLERVIREELARRGVEHRFEVVSNPEFLKEGRALEDFLRPDRIVVGTKSEWAREVMRGLYEPFVKNGHPLLFMDRTSSELTKYAANAMLATRISLMNELSALCDKVGADIQEVRRGIGTDRRIGMDFLYAGIGYGGSCFPKDVKALAKSFEKEGLEAELLGAVDRVNQRQQHLLARRVVKRFGEDLGGRHFAVWGLAFKAGTDDVREASSLVIIRDLVERGANVTAYDPVAIETAKEALRDCRGVQFAHEKMEALYAKDALLILTEWPEFTSPDFEEVREHLRLPVIFDGRNLLSLPPENPWGLEYHAIGRGRP